MKRNNTGFNALRLISLSEIKPNLRVSAPSSEAGEIKKCLSQSRREHREKDQFMLAAPKNQKKSVYKALRLIYLSKIKPKLRVSAFSS